MLRTLALIAALSGCQEPHTQVAVFLSTDLAAPTEIEVVELSILDDDGEPVGPAREISGLALGADGSFSEIGSFGVRPLGGDAARSFEIRATAIGPDDQRLFETRARSGFVSSRTIRLDVYLPRSCILLSATCAEDETCGLGGCVDPFVPPESLPPPEEPPEEPTDPRERVEPPPLRLIGPLAGARSTSRTPTLAVASSVDGYTVEVCRDRACADVVASLDAPGELVPALDDGATRYFWRATARVDGEARATPTWWFEVPAISTPYDAQCGHRLDVDGDARVDLAVGAPSGAEGRVWLLRSRGADVATWPRLEIPAPAGADGFGEAVEAAGDVDGDGLGDLVVGAPAAGAAFVYLGRDLVDGEVESPHRLIPPNGAVAFGAHVAGGADLNGDGYADVVVGDPSRRLTVAFYPGSPSGPRDPWVFRNLRASGSELQPLSIVGSADLDRDGRAEVWIGVPEAGPRGVILGVTSVDELGRLHVAEVAAPEDRVDPGDGFGGQLFFGNFQGDGACDLMTVSSGDGELVGLEGRPEPLVFTPFGFLPAEIGPRVGVADLNGDGFDDLLRDPLGTFGRGNLTLRHFDGNDVPGFGVNSGLLIFPAGASTEVGAIAGLGELGVAGPGDEIAISLLGDGVYVLSGSGDAQRLEAGGDPRFGAALR